MDFSGVSDILGGFRKKFSSGKDDKDEKKEVKEPTLPDTAKDIYGDADEQEQQEQEQQSSQQQPPAQQAEERPPDELPDFDFGSSEPEQSQQASQPQQPRPQKDEHQIVQQSSESLPSMDEEIKQFEEAVQGVQDMYHQEYLERDTTGDDSYPGISESMEKGFFSEFHQFLEGNDIPSVADELLSKDLLEKMKEYHMHKDEGKPHYFHTKEIEDAVQKKMHHLRGLERDWFVHKERMEKEEKLLMQKEEKIEEELQELKYLMDQLKKRNDFLKQVDEEDYFYLSNGHTLKSLAGLKTALRVMEDSVYRYHAGGSKNDFAVWVEKVFGKTGLADELRKCTSKDEMLKALIRAEES